MSKLLNLIFLITLPSLQILQLFNNSFGQDISIKVRLESSPAAAIVEGRFNDPDDIAIRRNLSFLNEYAGFDELGERIWNVSLTDGDGQRVEFRQLIPGEFLAEGPFVNWRYRINLGPSERPSAGAHVSWVSGNLGILMLDDLLPQFSKKNAPVNAKIEFELPSGWQIYSTEKRTGERAFEATNIEKAIFLIGKDIRQLDISAGDLKLKLLLAGEWQFSDAEAAKMVSEIYAENRKLFGADPASIVQVGVLRFPRTAPQGMWEADTRGATVTVLSSDMPFKSQSLQRLHEQLRHEIFHLWIPNGLNLTGNYDWFYEGFALYHSLKSGVLSNHIRFEDFLDTLSHAYNIDTAQNPRLSPIVASQKRWSGANTQVYARGILMAFLCDIALLKVSRGNASVDDVLKEIFVKYPRRNAPTDGNTAILSTLRSRPVLMPIVDKYINGDSPVEWREYLANAGIDAKEENLVTVLRVTAKPSGQQKELLDKLGYNSWRKLTNSSK